MKMSPPPPTFYFENSHTYKKIIYKKSTTVNLIQSSLRFPHCEHLVWLGCWWRAERGSEEGAGGASRARPQDRCPWQRVHVAARGRRGTARTGQRPLCGVAVPAGDSLRRWEDESALQELSAPPCPSLPARAACTELTLGRGQSRGRRPVGAPTRLGPAPSRPHFRPPPRAGARREARVRPPVGCA